MKEKFEKHFESFRHGKKISFHYVGIGFICRRRLISLSSFSHDEHHYLFFFPSALCFQRERETYPYSFFLSIEMNDNQY